MGNDCIDEIILIDEDGNSMIEMNNGNNDNNPLSSSSSSLLCYTTTQKIQFQYTYCNPTSIGDWIGVFPSRALFLDRLVKQFIRGKVLECGDGEPCEESNVYQPRIKQQMIAPPITDVGEYRLFIVKKSDWPYEYVTQTTSFRIIEEGQSCDDNNDITEDNNNDEDEDGSIFDGFMDGD